MCCWRKHTSINSTDDSHSRFCRGISSALGKIQAMRLANTTLPYDAHGHHTSAQSMRHANGLSHSNGKCDIHYHPSPATDHYLNKVGLKSPPLDIEDALNLNDKYDTSESLRSERWMFLDSCWKEMERVFNERPRHINDSVHRGTKKRLYVEEITSTVSWKTEGSAQILFAPTITHQFTLYTPVEATNEASTSVTGDYLLVIGLQDEPAARSTLALPIPESKRQPGWI